MHGLRVRQGDGGGTPRLGWGGSDRVSSSCISMKNQECKVRPEIININSNNPMFYPFSIKVNMVIVIILMTHMQEFVFLIL